MKFLIIIVLLLTLSTITFAQKYEVKVTVFILERDKALDLYKTNATYEDIVKNQISPYYYSSKPKVAISIGDSHTVSSVHGSLIMALGVASEIVVKPDCTKQVSRGEECTTPNRKSF